MFEWRGFWRSAAQPYATLIAGSAALGAGLLALFNGDLQRAADAERSASQQAIDTTEAERVHRRETTKDLRARFTTVTTQLADAHPTIRRSGVYAMAALADDWIALGDSLNDAQVCVDVLTAYLATPNDTVMIDDDEFADDAGADGAIRAIIIRLLTEHAGGDSTAARDWSGLNNYDLRGADLRAVSCAGADIPNAVMTGASLKAANLVGSNLVHVRLDTADLRRAVLVRCDLTAALLVSADLRRATLSPPVATVGVPETTLIHAQLVVANLAMISAERVCFVNANLMHATLTGADLTATDFSHADLRFVIAHGVILTNATLVAADMANGAFDNASFNGADLRDARLEGASLKSADLRGANLQRCANLTHATLDEICWDSTTTWPVDFTPPPSVPRPPLGGTTSA